MRRLLFLGLILALAATIHIDWHLARSTHHRLSLGWTQHWIFAAVVFFAVGWLTARLSKERPEWTAFWVAALAIVLAQGIEPALEVALYEGRLGYPSEPGRWSAFFVCIAAGLPLLFAAARFCRPRGAAPDAAASR
jgi:hypothetical protein